jgi:hypothetical protein
MAYVAWIASELDSATSFPKGNIIPQKAKPDEGQECWLGTTYAIRHTPRRLAVCAPDPLRCREGVYRAGDPVARTTRVH